MVFLIFIISTAVRFGPIYHKGYSYGLSVDNLILARNLSLVGEYKIDNEKNVVLSSEVVKERGKESQIGNKLTPILYSKVFDIFGINKNIPLWTSLILYGIVSVLLFLLVLKLFNIWIALIFSFVEILSPLINQFAIRPGFYEWAALFLTVTLFLYLRKRKPNLAVLFFSGLFLGLASLARNSFLIIPFAFLVYDFYKSRSLKRVLIFILPVFILWGIYLGPSIFQKGEVSNVYLSSKETSSGYLHIFPDPYTWHFERDAYVEKIKGADFYNYDYSQFLSKYGYPVSLKDKISMYWASIISYPKGLFAQTTIGGPFLIFFLVLGGFYLHKKRKDLLELFTIWAVLTYLFLITMASNHWGHFLSLQFPIFLLISLGIYWTLQFVLKQNLESTFKYLLIFGVIFVLSLHLTQSNKWTFHERYLYSKVGETLNLVKAIERKEDKIDKVNDVIAVGSPNSRASFVLNWYTDFSYVYFDPHTVEKLIEEDKLQWAFKQFGVTKILGYDEELAEKIIEATGVEGID